MDMAEEDDDTDRTQDDEGVSDQTQDDEGVSDNAGSSSSTSGDGSLGISINLTQLSRQPPAGTAAASTIAGGSFVEPVGPTTPLPSSATAIEIFRQIFDDDLMGHIVDQTNLYARQNPRAQYNWKDLTKEELEAFLVLYC